MSGAVEHSRRRDPVQIALNIVVLALMSVSIRGQVDSIEPKLGLEFAVVFAMAHDAAAIIALNCAMNASSKAVKVWAMVASLMAAATGASLNAWHAMADLVVLPNGELGLPELPKGFGLLIGVEPILLILVMSHLVTLYIAAKRSTTGQGGEGAGAAARPPQTARPAAGHGIEVVVGDVGGRQSTHVLADVHADRQATSPDHQPVTARPPAPTGAPARTASRQLTSATAVERPRVSSRVEPRQVLPANAVCPSPAQIVIDRSGPRPPWMTDELLHGVAAAIIAARSEPKPRAHGRTAVMEEHDLTDNKAKAVLAFIVDHDVIRESA